MSLPTTDLLAGNQPEPADPGRSGTTARRPSRRSRAGVRVVTAVAVVVVGVLVLAAVAPWLFTQIDPLATDTAQARRPPGPGHAFGTDVLGRDVLARVIHGARLSLGLGVAATALAVAVSTVLGVATGLAPRGVDAVVMRVLEIVLAFPEILVALVVVALLGSGTGNVLVAITIAAIPLYTRMVRVTTLQVRQSGFVEASRALGQHPLAIVVRHILPNVVGPLLVLATIGIGNAIIAGSALSFLGLGPASPTPEWGLMLADGRNSLGSTWWVAVFPGLLITVTVVSTTIVGRAVQRRFDGRLQ